MAGTVIADGQRRPWFERERVRRLLICGGDLPIEIPSVRGGWEWDSRSIHDDDPDARRGELQLRMRQDEGVLAERLCEEGHLVVVDGPFHYVRSRDLPVIGYVKTHSRALLGPEHHRELPRLQPGERTECRRVLAPRATFVAVGGSAHTVFGGGQTVKHLAGVRLASIGSGQKAVLFIAQLKKADLLLLQGLLEAGRITPVIDRRNALDEAGAAFHYMGDGHAKGKIVIDVCAAGPGPP